MRSWLLAVAAEGARRLPLGARLALYRLGPVTRMIRAALNLAAPVGTAPVRVASGDLAGRWLMLDLQVDKDLWLGTYEPEMGAAIAHFARAGTTVCDVGANLGYNTLRLAGAVGEAGRVFAFEPLPENIARLTNAVTLNGLAERVEVVAAAVADRIGSAEFVRHASAAMGRLDGGAGEKPSGATTTVAVTTLDAFVFTDQKPPPSLIKIDVEGGEAAALRGMRRLLREHRPTLLIEIHAPDVGAAVVAELTAAGYRLHRLVRGYPSLPSGGWDRQVVALPSGLSA